jgi:hypothetical protein
MSNYAWVCFDCRAAVRRPGAALDVRCPSCAKQCHCLGYKIPIPPKAKVKEWSAVEEEFFRAKRDALAKRIAAAVRQRHDLEQEIARLEAMPSRPGRLTAIRLLKKNLR